MKNTLSFVVLLAAIVWVGGAARADDPLPTPWNGMDIGGPSPAGVAHADGGAFTITAGGAGLAGASDQFHFVFQSVTGDFALVARVTPSAGPGTPASGGLMVRDALATTSNFVAVAQTSSQGMRSQYRTPSVPRVGTDTAAASGAVWLRLVKRGTTVSSYLAADAGGAAGAWKKVGSDQPIASGMIYAGLWLAGASPGAGGQATFDHVSLVSGTQPALDDGVYTIVPVSAPALVLSLNDGKVGLAAPGQRWMIESKGGLYAIRPAQNVSLALAVAGGASASGTGVVVQADRGQPAERWSVITHGDGTYGLAPQCAPDSGLDDLGGNTTPAARIDIWQRWDGDPHTEWAITPAP